MQLGFSASCSDRVTETKQLGPESGGDTAAHVPTYKHMHTSRGWCWGQWQERTKVPQWAWPWVRPSTGSPLRPTARPCGGGCGPGKTTCLLSPQACVRRGRCPLVSERHAAPPAARGQRGRLAPLLPHGGCGLGAGLPGPDGLLACHPDALRAAAPSDPGAERDPGLASEAAPAQVLSRLQAAYHGEGMWVSAWATEAASALSLMGNSRRLVFSAYLCAPSPACHRGWGWHWVCIGTLACSSCC